MSETNGGQGNTNNNSGAGASGGAGNTANTGNQAACYETLSTPEIKDSGSLKRFKSVEDLATAYLSAEKAIGGNKITIPDQHGTDEDWKKVYQKLGLPEAEDKYEVKFGDQFDKDFAADFKKTAFASGILPKQAQKLIEWYEAKNKGFVEAAATAQGTAVAEQTSKLKAKYGQAYEQEVGKAKAVLQHHGSKELVDFLNQTKIGEVPLASHPAMMEFCLSVAGLMKEGQFKGESFFGNSLTPQQALQKANAIIADSTHPYHNKSHPNHNSAVREVTELFNQAG